MTQGILPITSLPGWPSPPDGILNQLAAVTPCFVSPDGLHVGDVDAANAFLTSFVGSATQLAHNKDAWLNNLAALYVGKYAAGFNYTVPGDASGSHNYQIDPDSLQSISGAGSWAMACLTLTTVSAPISTWPAGFAWIDSNNTGVAMTAPQCAAFATNAAYYLASLVIFNRATKNAILAAADMATLAAIDVTVGWPANP
jgi:hypothetical protein